jgi:hypothetical protein
MPDSRFSLLPHPVYILPTRTQIHAAVALMVSRSVLVSTVGKADGQLVPPASRRVGSCASPLLGDAGPAFLFVDEA